MVKKIIASLMLAGTICGVADARKVSGTVTCGETRLEGVIVTDGTNFTTTSKKGKFSFEIKDDAEHVYIVTPAGYVADWTSGVPAFYKEAPGCSTFDFVLERTAGGNDYSIIAIADPQTYSEEHMAQFAGQPLQDLTATAKKLTGPVVGLSLGDISWDELARLDDYKREIVRTGVPFYPVVGNHDNSAWCKGDIEGSALYRAKMGPENYAFFMGKDVVIVLDNIIYDTNFKANVGYADHVIEWVRGLMPYIPSGAEIYIAQHAPTLYRDRKMYQANRLLDIVRGRKMTFLSGHSHINHNFTIEKNMVEHNIAAICGAWWDTEHCTDGTPRGYKVFTKTAGKLSWYYKSVGCSESHQAEVFLPGETLRHPSCLVANVWDWDPQWKVEWYEDGVFMGAMDPVREVSPVFAKEIAEAYGDDEIPGWKSARPSGHHFAAQPSRNAKRVTVSVTPRFGKKWVQTFDLRGITLSEEECTAAGDSLENVFAMVDRGVNTLKFDLYADMEGGVHICSADGPLLSELLDKVDEYTTEKGLSPRWFTFTFRTVKGGEEGKTVPYYHDFVDACMNELWPRFLGDRLSVICPDSRAARHLTERYPEVIQL